MVRFFRSLRGKLILTYTLVTVLALLALEVSAIGMVLLFSRSINADQEAYLSDVVTVLAPQARIYLQPGSEDLPGLQAWLDDVYASGMASLPPQGWFDSPAAMIVKTDPMVVLSPEGTILAQAGDPGNALAGRRYTGPEGTDSQRILEAAYRGDFRSLDLYAVKPDGTYLMAVPVAKEVRSSQLVGVVLVTIQRPPPVAAQLQLWPVLAWMVLITGLMLLVGVAPFGALFGLIMSRGLTRRLSALTLAADAWSEGNFSIQPQDRSHDEISLLGVRMRRMAERVQALLHTQHELAMLEERNRLARELHDTVKQQAFATLMQVRAAKNLLAADPDTALQHLEEAEGLIKTSQLELGAMIAELRPAALDGRGLAEALKGYLETWSKQTCIPVEFTASNERRLPLPVDQALYRVAQEALANVARHSRASAVTVRLAYEPRQVCLSVADNGVGFDVPANSLSGMGLQSMRERATALGGELSIRSAGEAGTTVTAALPVT